MAGLRHPRQMKLRLRDWPARGRWVTICWPRADADLMLGACEPV